MHGNLPADRADRRTNGSPQHDTSAVKLSPLLVTGYDCSVGCVSFGAAKSGDSIGADHVEHEPARRARRRDQSEPAPPFVEFAGPTNIGWYYAPTISYTLTGIFSHFRAVPNGTGTRTMTVQIWTDREAAGGTLLA